MDKKVVYLFGAGASYNAIPVVSGMGSRLKTFLKYFKNFKSDEIDVTPNSAEQINVNWITLVDEVNESFSIDTLARRAWLSNDRKKFSEIKQLIGAYILWEQIVKPENSNFIDYIDSSFFADNSYREASNRFNYSWDGNLIDSSQLIQTDIKLKNYDYRYESLFSVIAEKRNKLSDAFSFISWNYDNQVEIAINRIFNLEEGDTNDERSNEQRKNILLLYILRDKFFKLNGSASLSTFDFEPISRFGEKCKNEELDRIHQFLTGRNEFKNRIQFAWETSMEFDRERVKPLLKEAKYFVIIGYSFPEYNRAIDKQLIEAATIGMNTQIVVQDTADNVDRIISRINSIKPNIDVIKYTDLNQFYVPSI